MSQETEKIPKTAEDLALEILNRATGFDPEKPTVTIATTDPKAMAREFFSQVGTGPAVEKVAREMLGATDKEIIEVKTSLPPPTKSNKSQ